MSTELRIADIKARLRRITPGDWSLDKTNTGRTWGFEYGLLVDNRNAPWTHCLGINIEQDKPNAIGNAQFIAHAPEDIRFLLDLIAAEIEATA